MDKKTKIAAIIISLSFLITLSISLTNHISGDGCWHMSISRFISETGKLPTFEYLGRTDPFWPPPLFHIINAAFYKFDSLFGLDGFFIRLILPLASLFCLTLIFLITKKIYGKNIAVYSVLFLAFIPIFIDYSSNYHIEIFLTCLMLGSIYFILKGRLALAGLFFGLSVLSKFNAPLILPALIYLIYSKHKTNLKKYALFFAASSIGILSYVRSYLIFGNPVWPSLRSIFGGITVEGFGELSTPGMQIPNFLNIKVISANVLGLFGVPGGDARTISFLNIPFVSFLFASLVIVGIIYLIPAILSLYRILKNPKKISKVEIFLILWILPFAIFNIFYKYSETRMLIPIMPAIAILWAIGFNSIIKKVNLQKKMIITFVLLSLIAVSFAGIIIFKSRIASNEWNRYDKDYVWIKENMPKDALFYSNGQCLTINTERNARFLPLNKEDYKYIKTGYFFFNEKFNIEPQVTLTEEQQKFIQKQTKCAIIYSNPQTGTSICKI